MNIDDGLIQWISGAYKKPDPFHFSPSAMSSSTWLPSTVKRWLTAQNAKGYMLSCLYTQGENIHHSKRKKSTGFELRPRKVHMLKLKPAET